MKNLFYPLLFASLFSLNIFAQQEVSGFQKFRNEMNASYRDSVESPLLLEDRLVFNELNFFDYDSSFCVMAVIVKKNEGAEFGMITSTSRRPTYRTYAIAIFNLKGQKFSIPIYQSKSLLSDSLHADYLFMPFTDLTNDIETYGGGRYLDLKIQNSDTLMIDFNFCYQPYCAYNHKYSCPIPPPENFINLRITAGVRSGYLKK